MRDELELLTPDEVAKYFQISKRTLQRWTKLGEIPGRKVGGQWRYARVNIEKYLQQQLQQQERRRGFHVKRRAGNE